MSRLSGSVTRSPKTVIESMMNRAPEGMSLMWMRTVWTSGLARRVMEAAGVEGPFVWGMLNGGHFGGTVPLDRASAGTLRPASLPEGLWVADLSLAPRSEGMPSMLVAAALALRVARRIAGGATRHR